MNVRNVPGSPFSLLDGRSMDVESFSAPFELTSSNLSFAYMQTQNPF